jgi:TetR/AcrR family transcriptional repressor of nem operon
MPRAANPRTRQRLLDAAEALILQRGFAGTSVDDICQAARLTKGSFFHCFQSKDQLAVEAVQRFYQRFRDATAAAPFRAHKDPLRRVIGYFDFLIGLAGTNAAAPGCLVGGLAQELAASNPRIRRACAGCFDDWAQALRADLELARTKHAPRARLDPSSLAGHCIAVLEGALILAKSSGDPRVVVQSLEHLKRYLSLLFNS